MSKGMEKLPQLFSTCPPSGAYEHHSYLGHVAAVARWSEDYGCAGILVYADNSLVDPWLISQVIIQNTKSLCPLVAVQPIYMHPYTVAKMVASFGFLFGRRVCLNMVAGGFKNDLHALNDRTPHDQRYARLIEYSTIIKQLLVGPGSVTYEGEFCRVDKLRMTPPLPAELFPRIFVSGSSQAGLDAARILGATAVKYPQPANDEPPVDGIDVGARVGIIAREVEEEAWQIAEQRFPEDRKGQITHELATKVSDSAWHHQLSRIAEGSQSSRSVYWLRPFENYKTFCPYLVGSYDQVGEELATYLAQGYETFILDVPPNPEEFGHIQTVFGLAREKQKTRAHGHDAFQPRTMQEVSRGVA
jgi:alkanesulfonate monooxygenase